MAGPGWPGAGHRPPPVEARPQLVAPAPPPTPAEAPADIAGFGWRLAAWLIDLFSIWVGLVIIIAAIGTDAIAGDPADPATQAANQRLLFVGLLFQVGYYWLWNALGWSPGKRVLGLRIVDAAGEPPGAGRGFARTVGVVLSSLPLWLGYLWALRDPNRQTWHDKIAGTYVVRRR